MRYEVHALQTKEVIHEKRMRSAYGVKVFISIHLYPVLKPYAINALQQDVLVTTIEVVVLIIMDLD